MDSYNLRAPRRSNTARLYVFSPCGSLGLAVERVVATLVVQALEVAAPLTHVLGATAGAGLAAIAYAVRADCARLGARCFQRALPIRQRMIVHTIKMMRNTPTVKRYTGAP